MGNRRGRKRNRGRFFLIIILISIVAGVGIYFGVNYYATKSGEPVDPGNQELIAVEIPSGSSTERIGDILEENGLAKSAGGFKLLAKMYEFDGKFQAGTYYLSPSMPAREIMEKLTKGVAETKRFTVPEGLTVAKTADKLSGDGLVDRDAFLKAAEDGTFDYGFMASLPSGPNRLEGFLFPETYDVYATANEWDVINRMLLQFDKVFTDEYAARAEEMGYSVYDIITIAALIEAEARTSVDRPLIASVIYNRLEIGMRLQLDATVQYALGETKERLYQRDLEVDSPYNTYKIAGLPPGPICSPGADAIHAALYPENTDYIYYVLKPDGSGSHNFAKNETEFYKYKKEYIDSL